jgi:hypothetical protein
MVLTLPKALTSLSPNHTPGPEAELFSGGNMRAFYLVAAFAMAMPCFAAEHPMQAVKKAMHGKFNPGLVEKMGGFSAKELHRRPKMTEGFKQYLAKLEEKKRAEYEKWVMTNDEEFGELSKEERVKKSKNATGELGVRFLVEIDDVYQISQDGKVVGYVYETSDHVDAAKIQDGSGIDMYLDTGLNVIAIDKWQS